MKTKLFALLLSIPLAAVAFSSAAQVPSRPFSDDTFSAPRVATAVAQTRVHRNAPATTPPVCVLTANPPRVRANGGAVTVDATCTGSVTFSVSAAAPAPAPPYTYLWSGPEVDGQTTQQVSSYIANTAAFSVVVNNSAGTYAGSIMVPVDMAVSPATLPPGAVGTLYSQSLSTSGGSGSYSYARSGGALPPGITLSPAGAFFGTPTTAGKFAFTVTVSDTEGGSFSRSYDLSVTAPPIALSPPALNGATVGLPYSQPVTASGGTQPYRYAVTTGSLPPGIALDAGTGLLSGTPTSPGTSAFTITATDAASATASKAYTLAVAPPASVDIAPPTLADAVVGTAYSQPLTANNGVGTYAFSITQGSLPANLQLSTTGVISGMPTQPGTFTFTVTATGGSAVGSRQYTLNVGTPIAVAPASIPSATVNTPYSQAFSATGGSGTYAFSVQGTLPAGLALSGNTLSGTPTTAGTSTFTIVATDTRGATGSRLYALPVNAPPATRITQISAKSQTATAGQPLAAPLVVLVADTNGTPITGAGAQLVATSSVPGDVIAAPVEPPGKPGQYAFNVALSASTAARTVTICLTTAASQCVGFVIGTSQQVGQDARQVIGPQGTAAITTPTQQLGNISQHLDNRRMMRNPSVMQGLGVSVNGQALPPMSAFTVVPAGKEPVAAPSGGGAAADDPFARWGFFVQGVIDIGKADATSLTPGFDVRTKGLTLGSDYRFDKGVAGVALGLTKASTSLQGSGGNQDAKGWSLSIFGEYVPVDNAYVDLIMNWGRNRYDTTRHGVDAAGSVVDFNSNPSGDQFGVSLSAGYQFFRRELTASPYVRVEYIVARIDPFTESGGAGAVEVSSQRYSSTVLTLGGLAQYSWSQSWGVLVPYARLELQYAAQTSAGAVSAQYAVIGLANDPVAVALPDADKSFGTIGVGATAVLPRGVSGYFNYQYLFGNDTFRDSRFTLGLRVEF